VSEPPIGLFEIDVSSAEGGVKLVALRGELDFDDAPRLGRVLDELRSEGELRVIVDLSELTFIDSSGLSVLVAAARAATAERQAFVLAAPMPNVQRVFDIVSLSELVVVEPAVDGAFVRVGKGREQTAG
jgi:anti-sigma B factor antagonist